MLEETPICHCQVEGIPADTPTLSLSAVNTLTRKAGGPRSVSPLHCLPLTHLL